MMNARPVARVLPDPVKPRSFPTEAAFERWLAANHARETEIWLKIYKVASGVPTVTHAQALDVALCWGWIDGIRKSFDAQAFLQRFTPRRPKSVWSQVNREHVARLARAGRMRPPGERQVDAAKADGRWAAAYAPIRSASVGSLPADLRRAIDANRRARRTFETLGRVNLFALAYRTNAMKTPAGRAKKIADLVAMLARGDTIVPERKPVGRPPLWRCPNCRRRFANRNQSHACARLSLVDHFRGKPPRIRALYDAFVAMVQACGPVTILPEKTRIAFQARMSFAALVPKRAWVDGHLVLAARHPGPHVRRVETFSPRNHLHAFRLDRVDQLDAEFQALVRMAYAVGEQRHLDR